MTFRRVRLSDAMPTDAGLCNSCAHRREIVSDRGSVFLMCLLSRTDPAFPKYPRLPVLRCSGYQPVTPA